MALKDLYSPILSDLDLVKDCLRQSIESTEVAELKAIATHLSQSPGKQVRAALCLSAFALCNKGKNKPQSLIPLAAAIECIHLASLIHDDIIDNADTRRNQAAVQKKWGANKALVSGVYVYSKALDLITQVGSIPILEIISNTVSKLCEGEFTQMCNRHTIYPSPDHYLNVIKNKTAVLFEAACLTAAELASASQEEKQKLRQFGEELGMIFQITDDYLDLFGDGTALAKQPGQDILSGEYTLPFYYVLDSLESSEKDTLLSAIQSQDPTALPLLQSHITRAIAEQTKATLKQYLDKAQDTLNIFPKSAHKATLEKMLGLISKRCF